MLRVTSCTGGEIALEEKDKIEERVRAILDRLQSVLDSHEGFAEIIEVKDNKVVLYCGGKCAGCDNKCIESAIKDELPDVEVILQM